ncbi:hypothetical protein HY640_03820 [Candidatus Woesearchaeota archaeon]|nr:hypothetical protein [Candidatus Woesearchaeota archaeon]
MVALMDSGWIIVVVVLAILVSFFLAHKLFQEAFEFMGIAVSIIGIALVVSIVVVAFDAVSFKRSFPGSESLLIVMDEKTPAAAILLKKNVPEPIEQEKLAPLATSINAKDYKTARGTNYKLIIIKKAAIDDLSQKTAGNSTKSPPEEQAFIASSLSGLAAEPSLFIAEYRKGNIIVYPETPMFKAIKYLPGFGNYAKDSIGGLKGLLGRENETQP